jgi:hypothetical protein
MTYLLALQLLLSYGGTYGGFGGFFFGGNTPAIEDLNSTLKNNGLPELETPFLTTGGGGYALIGKIFLGGSGFGGRGVAEGDSLKIVASTGGGFFEFGLQHLLHRSLIGYLMLGIGGYGIELELRPYLEDVEFEDLLKDPKRTSTLSMGGFALETALGLHYWFPMGKKGSFLSLFLKGGLIFTPSLGDWKLKDGAEVLKGPDVGSIHPVFQIGVCFGGKAPIPRKK